MTTERSVADFATSLQFYNAGYASGRCAIAAEFREVVLGLRRHDLPDGACWCATEPNKTNGWRHVRACRAARAALADTEPAR